MKTEEIARVCHEVNRDYRLAIHETPDLSWENAPGWQ